MPSMPTSASSQTSWQGRFLLTGGAVSDFGYLLAFDLFPSVSILIPCFNAAPYLAQTLQSAIAQVGLGTTEILLWDDGSTDDSVAIARQFEPHVKVLGDGVNRGGNVARNRLLEAATGDWLQYLDADDVLLPGKIATQLQAAIETGADLVYAPPLVMSDGEIDAYLGDDKLGSQTDTTSPQVDSTADVWVDYIRWGVFQTTSMLVRHSAIVEVGGWKKDQPRCQEHELLLRLLCAGKRFARIENQQTLYRVVDGTSVSRRNTAATTTMRMELTTTAEQHLRGAAAMTGPRLSALAAARLEAARSLYRHDRQAATLLANRVGRSGILRAAPSDALPKAYRFMAASLGFPFAEWVARVRRQ